MQQKPMANAKGELEKDLLQARKDFWLLQVVSEHGQLDGNLGIDAPLIDIEPFFLEQLERG